MNAANPEASTNSSLFPATSFAWVGTVLVNAAFISLVSWGTLTLWPLGFTLCGVYTFALFSLARYMDRVYEEDTVPNNNNTNEQQAQDPVVENLPPSDPAEEDENEEANRRRRRPHDEPKIPILVSLLYGLAVIAMGVTGFFLPVNYFSCTPADGESSAGEWKTDAAALPPAVRHWATIDTYSGYKAPASFIYVPATESTFFAGTNQTSEPYQSLWELRNATTGGPVNDRRYQFPTQFTLVAEDSFCFVAQAANMRDDLVCSDSVDYHSITIDAAVDQLITQSLLADDNQTLWYKTYTQERAFGQKVYAVYTPANASATAVLYTHFVPRHNNHSKHHHECDSRQSTRRVAAGALFVTALPVTATSVHIWHFRNIPSMATTTFVGLCLVFACLCWTLNPDLSHLDRPFQVWYSLASAIWMLVLCRLLLMDNNNRVHKDPLRWGLNIGSLAYWWGMLWLTGASEHDRWWQWTLWTALCLVPLIVLGIGAPNGFAVILGATGLLVDVARLAAYVGVHQNNSNWQFLTVFVVFCMGGMGIGALGYVLTQYQKGIQAWLKRVLTWEPTWHLALDDDAQEALLPTNDEEQADDHQNEE